MTEAYFAKPPESDIMIIADGVEVLASPNPWRWDKAFGLFINERTGEGRLPTGENRPVDKSGYNASVGEINADVYVHQVDAREREGGIGLEGDVAKIIYVDGVSRRLRGDGAQWRLAQSHLKRDEQARRMKKFHPSMTDVKPADFISAEDRARFHEEAKNIMAQLCNLTRFLPRCEIMAVKQPTRLLEMVEREMWSIEGANREKTAAIAAEYRATGGGVPEIHSSQIHRLQQQKQGFSFQYAYCQMLFAAWRESYDEIMTEHEGLATSLPGAEFDGNTWNYVKLRDRVERRKKLAKETDRAWQTQKAMLLKLSMQDYHKWLYGRTTYEPRQGGVDAVEATPQVAQPMTGWEIDSDPVDRE
jgi:hypothetical protein